MNLDNCKRLVKKGRIPHLLSEFPPRHPSVPPPCGKPVTVHFAFFPALFSGAFFQALFFRRFVSGAFFRRFFSGACFSRRFFSGAFFRRFFVQALFSGAFFPALFFRSNKPFSLSPKACNKPLVLNKPYIKACLTLCLGGVGAPPLEARTFFLRP